jgi:hypothetical protein
MPITFGSDNRGLKWDHDWNNLVYNLPSSTPRKADEDTIRAIMSYIPRLPWIKGTGRDTVIDYIENDKDIKVVKGLHNDEWQRSLGMHMSVQLGDYADPYHIYVKYNHQKNLLLTQHISKGQPNLPPDPPQPDPTVRKTDADSWRSK